MLVETVIATCELHKNCEECPYWENDSKSCAFSGTPDTWDPYGNKGEDK